jgi:hypothetical protein
MKYYDVYLEGGHIIPIQDPRDDMDIVKLFGEFLGAAEDDITMFPEIKRIDACGAHGAISSVKIIAIIESVH